MNQPSAIPPARPQLTAMSADLPSYNTAITSPSTTSINPSILPPINPIQSPANTQVNQQDRSQALASFANTTPSTELAKQ